MAIVTITRQFPDGDAICIEIKVRDSFPDVIAEAKAAAMSAYREAVADALALPAPTEDTE